MPLQPVASLTLDADQQHIIGRLDRLASALSAGETPSGLYLYGSVGRGKTWLCDRFFEQLPTSAKRRVHFHSFFRQLHRDIWSHRARDPAASRHSVDRAVAALLDGIDLLYFDEFHVQDSGDAALVLRVLDEVLASDVTLVATSNYAPADLLPGPFHHVFEGGIQLIEHNLDVVQLGGDHDYRRGGAGVSRGGFADGSWCTLTASAQPRSAALSRPTLSEQTQLTAGGHRFTARRTQGRQLWFSFAELCERDSSVADYLHWAMDYDVWVVDGVPLMADATPQAAKRFANLVDVLCDRDATLHILSDHSLDAVFDRSRLPLDSARTASRLALLGSPPAIHTQR
ncbi:MAG: cell division protein ZapE [Homoserinimonas sp.]